MYYRVNLYKLENKINKSNFINAKAWDERRKPKHMGKVIVDRKNNETKEIFTEFSLDVYNLNSIDNKGLIKDNCCDFRRLREEKIIFFILEDEIIKENVATLKEVDEYFETFFDSEFKVTYDKMNTEDVKTKRTILKK